MSDLVSSLSQPARQARDIGSAVICEALRDLKRPYESEDYQSARRFLFPATAEGKYHLELLCDISNIARSQAGLDPRDYAGLIEKIPARLRHKKPADPRSRAIRKYRAPVEIAENCIYA